MEMPPSAPLHPELEAAPVAPKRTRGRLIWAGGVGLLLFGILVTWGVFSSTGGSSPLKSASVPNAQQVVTAVAETKSVPAQPSANSSGPDSWIPVYPGSTPEIVSSAQTPENDQSVATFKTSDAPPKVILYFQDQLRASGFNIKTASSGEESGSLQAEDGLKKRSLVLNVNSLPDGNGAEVRLVTIKNK